MHDYAEFLAREAESLISIYHQFTVLYSDDDNAVHAFLEGEDDLQFYLPFIRQRTTNLIRIYQCGGKPRLREIHDYILRRGYSSKRCLFFADRDFDDYTGNQIKSTDTIYLTDFYSIENELTTPQALCVILSDMLGVNEGTPDFNAIAGPVADAMDRFQELIRGIMAWCIAARKKGAKINLNNARMNKMFEVTSDCSVRRKTGAFAMFRKDVFAAGDQPTFKEVYSQARNLSKDEAKLWIRGKYELWFFEIAMTRAIEKSNSEREKREEKKLKLPTMLREHRLFEVMGGRVAPRASLETFLDARLSC